MEDHFWDQYHLSWQKFIVNIKHKKSVLIAPKERERKVQQPYIDDDPDEGS